MSADSESKSSPWSIGWAFLAFLVAIMAAGWSLAVLDTVVEVQHMEPCVPTAVESDR